MRRLYSLSKRVVGNDGVHLTEVTLNPETGSKISERIVSDSEMKLSDFDTMKEFLTESRSSTLTGVPQS